MFGSFKNIAVRTALSWVQTSEPSMKDVMKAAAMGRAYRTTSTPMNRYLVRCIKGKGALPPFQQARLELSVAARTSSDHRDLFSLASNNQGDFLVDAPNNGRAIIAVTEFLKKLDAMCVEQG